MSQGCAFIFLRKVCGQTFGNGAQLVGYNKTIKQSMPQPLCQFMQGSRKPGGGGISRLTDRLGRPQPAPVPATGQPVLVKYTVWCAEICPVLSAVVERCSPGAGGRHG